MSSRFYRKVRVLAVGALVISTLAAGPALAGGRPTPPAYTCGVSPDPVTNMSTFYVLGTGFPPGMVINAYIKDKISKFIVYGGLYSGGIVAADGTFSLGPIGSAAVYYPSDLGTKYVAVVNASNPKRALCACTFAVQ